MRGRLDVGLEDELLGFWQRRAGLGGEEARRRLPEVVCVLRRDCLIAGASSVFADELKLVGAGVSGSSAACSSRGSSR